MAFDPRNLTVLGYAARFALWQYRSVTDPARAIAEPGHLDAAAAELRADDLILVSAADRGLILHVVSVNGARVSVTEIAGSPQPPPWPPLDAILDMDGNPLLEERGAPLLIE
jgi:hypothetical protein